jgi:predicted amidohydrolase
MRSFSNRPESLTEVHREKQGHLTVGSAADVAVLRLDRGEFGFVDVDKFSSSERSDWPVR